jgi:hypothetical protein
VNDGLSSTPPSNCRFGGTFYSLFQCRPHPCGCFSGRQSVSSFDLWVNEARVMQTDSVSGRMTPYHCQYWAHLLTLEGAGGSIENLTRSISNARVDLNPHQVDTDLFALRSLLSKGAILADEVGLGKTIEAGIVLSQRPARLSPVCSTNRRSDKRLSVRVQRRRNSNQARFRAT